MPSGSKGSPSPLTQELAALLRELVARKRTNASQVAKGLPWSDDQVRRILGGTKHPDVDQLDAIARKLGVTGGDLLKRAEANLAAVGPGSETSAVVTPITAKRVEDMSVDELEALPKVATQDETDPRPFDDTDVDEHPAGDEDPGN